MTFIKVNNLRSPYQRFKDLKINICTKFQVKIPKTFKVMRDLQFSVDGRTDGWMDGWTDGPRPITPEKPRLKPRNNIPLYQYVCYEVF